MSLEDAVIANTAAVLKLVDALAKGGTKTSAADAAIDKEAARAAASKPPAKITIDTVTEAYAAYLDVADKAERKRRGGFLKQISAHFGVERISALETEAQFKEALGYCKRLVAGDEDLFPDEDVSI